jgi:hypothetical protein
LLTELYQFSAGRGLHQKDSGSVQVRLGNAEVTFVERYLGERDPSPCLELGYPLLRLAQQDTLRRSASARGLGDFHRIADSPFGLKPPHTVGEAQEEHDTHP